MSDAKRYPDAHDLFHRTKDYVVVLRFYESDFTISMEELYQAFKARILEEVATNNREGEGNG